MIVDTDLMVEKTEYIKEQSFFLTRLLFKVQF